MTLLQFKVMNVKPIILIFDLIVCKILIKFFSMFEKVNFVKTYNLSFFLESCNPEQLYTLS